MDKNPPTNRPLIILHGWSDASDSFEPLAKWLRARGFNVVEIFLANYISMNDEITLPDLGLAMRNALAEKNIPETRHAFDMLAHSTGALVAREFLRQACAGDASKTPVRHLCLLAPANFGSPLAKLGKSFIGRLFKGWSWNHLFETGKRVLDALELASPYTFELALDDLFTPGHALFHPENTMATVLAGTSPYGDTTLDKLKSAAHEDGSDGVVRASCANLNARHFQVDFEKPPRLRCVNVPPASPPAAFAVFDRNHTSVTRPGTQPGASAWRDILLNSLTLETEGYDAHVKACEVVTAETYSTLRAANPKSNANHVYQHLVFRVRDQFGAPVNDYFVEFYQGREDPRDTVFKKIQTEVLEKVVTNSTAPNHRSFHLDLTDLEQFLNDDPARRVLMSISAADISNNIRMKNPGKNKFIKVFGTDFPRGDFPSFGGTLHPLGFFFPNQTTLIDITLHRAPVPDVFKLNLFVEKQP